MWVTREIESPAATCWALLVDIRCWPSWGPSVAAARLDPSAASRNGAPDPHRIQAESTGAVRPVVGPWVRFRITEFDADHWWSWSVAGVPATSHRVEALGRDRCRVGFEVPPLVAPYALVCAVALRRIERLATG